MHVVAEILVHRAGCHAIKRAIGGPFVGVADVIDKPEGDAAQSAEKRFSRVGWWALARIVAESGLNDRKQKAAVCPVWYSRANDGLMN
jgi:hypothetical protein